ncbi:MAG TPA: hypothetical protein VN253_12960 [Kofleriaceae bacterium]|nr:hypothetical protein [Kofleriaceae bacterium]
MRPEIYPDDFAKPGIDYDLVTIQDKDPWPKLVAEQVQRAQTAFPKVSDDELNQFLFSLGR